MTQAFHECKCQTHFYMKDKATTKAKWLQWPGCVLPTLDKLVSEGFSLTKHFHVNKAPDKNHLLFRYSHLFDTCKIFTRWLIKCNTSTKSWVYLQITTTNVASTPQLNCLLMLCLAQQDVILSANVMPCPAGCYI